MIKRNIDYSKRSQRIENRYAKYRQKHNDSCDFCNIGMPDSINTIIENHKHFWVIKNEFPYSTWDSEKVVDHLLVVPKKHVASIFKLSGSQRNSLMKIINKYDKLGYSFMERSADNKEKSMTHQHTHLIKTTQ